MPIDKEPLQKMLVVLMLQKMILSQIKIKVLVAKEEEDGGIGRDRALPKFPRRAKASTVLAYNYKTSQHQQR